MCDVCRNYPCHYMCPNHQTPTSNYKCDVCNESILDGEEYIINDNGDYAHWECVDYGKDLLEWLGYEIKTMEDDY